MSLHAQLSAEAQERLNAQKRNTTVSSIIIALLLMALVGVILFIISMALPNKEIPTIVTYRTSSEPVENVQVKKVHLKTQRKPSAPAPSMARVITSNSASTVAIPVPDIVIEDISADFGDGAGLGAGWGSGDGSSPGGGDVTFFETKLKANRVAYVIDTSKSMDEKRQNLMRSELIKSLEALPPQMKYQIIFFSAPAWVAGSALTLEKRSAEVTHENRTYHWVPPQKGKNFPKNKTIISGWEQKGKKQRPQWQDATKSNIEKSVEIVKNEEMSAGTDWIPPLEMAFSMNPKPEIIYFMTDGASPTSGKDHLKPLIRDAKRSQTTINTIALMEPKAREGLGYLAEHTNGKFTIVHKDKTIEQVK